MTIMEALGGNNGETIMEVLGGNSGETIADVVEEKGIAPANTASEPSGDGDEQGEPSGDGDEQGA